MIARLTEAHVSGQRRQRLSRWSTVQPQVPPLETERTFDRIVDEGRQRLGRSRLQLIATGLLGGLDLGVGFLALLVVEQETGSMLLGALAFSVGFIALAMARSELFTENFLVPVAAVVAKAGSWHALARLWITTLATNLVACWLLAVLVTIAFPRTARERSGIGRRPHRCQLVVAGICARSRFRTFADKTQGKDDPTARTKPLHYWDQQAWRELQQFLPERLRLDEANSPEENFWDWRGSTVHLDRYRNADATAKVVLHHGMGANGRQMIGACDHLSAAWTPMNSNPARIAGRWRRIR